MPCQVYDGKCVLLNSLRSPDLYFDFLKKCSALYLQTGKFGLLGMHALVHLSGPVLPRFCCWLPIHHSMKCVKTIFTTDIVNIFYSYTLLFQMLNVHHKIYNESFTMKLYRKYPFTPSKLKNKYISTLKYCEYMCPGFAWSECMNYICTSLNVMLSCMF